MDVSTNVNTNNKIQGLQLHDDARNIVTFQSKPSVHHPLHTRVALKSSSSSGRNPAIFPNPANNPSLAKIKSTFRTE